MNCKDQAEVDEYWAKLGAGGEFGPCGWLKDRYGLSWQIVPVGMEEYLTDENPERAQRGNGRDAVDEQDRPRRGRGGRERGRGRVSAATTPATTITDIGTVAVVVADQDRGP